jgi:hypothetical protein
MTPGERLVAEELHTLADIPVTEQDVELARDELGARLGALPPEAPRRRRTRLLAAAAAAVLIATAAAVWASSRPPRDTEPTHTPSPSETAALATASAFVDAFARFDVPRARRLLAPHYRFSGAADNRGWPAVSHFFHETGQIRASRCLVVHRPEPGVVVDCPYRYQLMRSGELGLGPYRGSYFEIATQHGQITHINMHHETDTNGWSSQMWTPFATWVDTFHHADGAKMYPDWPQQGHWPATDAAIRLWSERTRQFVRYARHLCRTTHQTVFGAVCAGQPQGG